MDCFAPPVIGRAFARPVGSQGRSRWCCSARSSDHQHVEDHDRRQGQDHRPDAERPEDVLGRKTLLFRKWVIFRIHDAPAFLFLRGYRYASNFKKPVAISLVFDHRCYRELTTGAPPGATGFLSAGWYRALTKEVFVSRKRCSVLPAMRSIVRSRCSGTRERTTDIWTPDQQPTTRKSGAVRCIRGTKSRRNRIYPMSRTDCPLLRLRPLVSQSCGAA